MTTMLLAATACLVLSEKRIVGKATKVYYILADSCVFFVVSVYVVFFFFFVNFFFINKVLNEVRVNVHINYYFESVIKKTENLMQRWSRG